MSKQTGSLKVGALHFAVSPAIASGRYNQIDLMAVGADVTLTIEGSGYFTDAARTANKGTTVTAKAGETSTFYLSNGTYDLFISNKLNIAKIILGSLDTTSNYDNFSCDMAQFHGMPELVELELVGVNASGSAYEALKLNYDLEVLGLGGTHTTGGEKLLEVIPYIMKFSLPVKDDDIVPIKIGSGTNQFTLSATDGPVKLMLTGNIYFTNERFSTNNGTTFEIPAGTSQIVRISMSGSGMLYIIGAGNVSSLIIGDNMAGSGFDVANLAKMPKLTHFTWTNNANVSGDIGGVRKLKNLQILNLAYTMVSGDVSALQDLVYLTGVNLVQTLVGGDIRHLRDLVQLTYLNLSETGVYGTCQMLYKLTRLQDLGVKYTGVHNISLWKTRFNKSCVVDGYGSDPFVV